MSLSSESQEQIQEATETITSFKDEGNMAFKRGEFQIALESYSQGIEIAKESTGAVSNYLISQLYSNRAAVKLQTADFDGALQDANEAIRSDPNNMKGYYRAAKASFNLERFMESCETCEAGLRIDPHHAELSELFSICADRAGIIREQSDRGFSEEDARNCHERLQELEGQYQIVMQKIRGKELEIGRHARTTAILSEMGEVTCYKALGRSFFKDQKSDLLTEIGNKSKCTDDELGDLRVMIKRLSQTKQATENEMNEITAYFNRKQSIN